MRAPKGRQEAWGWDPACHTGPGPGSPQRRRQPWAPCVLQRGPRLPDPSQRARPAALGAGWGLGRDPRGRGACWGLGRRAGQPTHWGSVRGSSCSTGTRRSGCSGGRAPSAPPCPRRPAEPGCPAAPQPHGRPGGGGQQGRRGTLPLPPPQPGHLLLLGGAPRQQTRSTPRKVWVQGSCSAYLASVYPSVHRTHTLDTGLGEGTCGYLVAAAEAVHQSRGAPATCSQTPVPWHR